MQNSKSLSNKPYYPHPFIAREGWPFIAIALSVATYVQVIHGFWWAIPFWILSAFCIQFFRDPPRAIPTENPLSVLSPADGKIIVIDNQATDPILFTPAIKISIFMNVFNVHSNRSPVDGKIIRQAYEPGKFMNADFDKASAENERNAVVVELPTGHKVTFVQIAGLIARRILCYTKPGQSIYRGQRYGFIRFGSRVDVYLPLESSTKVHLGDSVKATTTILAELSANKGD